MTTFLNQILYNNTKFDSFDTILLLSPYMYKKSVEPAVSDYATPHPVIPTHAFPNSVILGPVILDPVILDPVILGPIVPNPIIQEYATPNPVIIPPIINSNIIHPKCTDTLFWCLYIAKYGYGDYLNIGQKYKNKEIEIKQQMIETIKKTPVKLKSGPRKITNVAVQEIMAELMIDNKTTFKTFYAMCLLNQLNMCIVDLPSNTYLPFTTATLDATTNQSIHYIIYKSASGFFSIDIEEKTTDQYSQIISNMVELEHGERPVRAISSYKVGDLETMAKRLHIFLDDSKKYKKQELYDEILLKCQWTVK